MGGFDDHVAIMGDWMLPSPSSRAFFSSLMGDDVGSRSIAEPTGEDKHGDFFPGPGAQAVLANDNQRSGVQTGGPGNQSSICSLPSEQRMSSRGGLRERMAARAGFSAPRLNTETIRPADLSQDQEIRSPYLTIPPGLSPTTLLDSPVFLSNSLVQPSPTTGKFLFAPSGSIRNSSLTAEASERSKERYLEGFDTSSFAFKPVTEVGPSLFLGATTELNRSSHSQQSFPNGDGHSENSVPFPGQSFEPGKLVSQDGSRIHQHASFSKSSAERDNGGNDIPSEPRSFDVISGGVEHSSPLDEQPDDDADQRGAGDSSIGGTPSEDGYNWRKYGQKHVKGSEYPRSYYKCTHPNCPVKKKVERSHEGHITEIIYKGAHNHSKPHPSRRSALGSSSGLSDMQLDVTDQAGTGADGDSAWTTVQKGNVGGASDWRHDGLEATSSLGPEYCNGATSLQAQNGNQTSLQAQNGNQFDAGDPADASSTFSNDEEEDDRGTHGSVSLGYDGEGDESESKRRKIETYPGEMSGATRAIREPRVVVQTTSEVDILDDGYRWRKYGQKVVKGNPNPRSYYKCTSAGCTVRKHVERASHDLKSVITTYEGKHNHDVPAARNSSHVSSGVSSNLSTHATAAVPGHIHRPEPSQLHSTMARFERPPLGSFGLPGTSQLGQPHGFGLGMNQAGLSNLAMAGMGPNQGKFPAMPVHSYMGQPRPVSDMGFMLPKGEPKMEPVSDPGLNTSNGASVYRQFMGRLPLGPQM